MLIFPSVKFVLRFVILKQFYAYVYDLIHFKLTAKKSKLIKQKKN